MRSNSSLYERMCRGEMAAWSDPGAILELLSMPGDEGLVTGAFKCASLAGSNQVRWKEDAVGVVVDVVSRFYDMVPRGMRINLLFSSCRGQYMRKLVGSVLTPFQYGGRPSFRGMKRLPTSDNGMRVFEALLAYSEGKDLSRDVFLEIGDDGTNLEKDFPTFSASLSELANYVARGGRSYSTIVHGFDMVCGKKVSMRIDMDFPDPVIWVPDHMAKNGRRR